MSAKFEKGVKKLVLALATSTPETETRKKAVETIKTAETAEAVETTRAGKDGKKNKGDRNLKSNYIQVLWIWYLINLRKKSVLVLLDLDIEVNAVYPTFAKELDFSIRPINVGV